MFGKKIPACLTEQAEAGVLPMQLSFLLLSSVGCVGEWCGQHQEQQDQCIAHDAVVPVHSPELGSGRNFPLGKSGKDSWAFWSGGTVFGLDFLPLGQLPKLFWEQYLNNSPLHCQFL